MRYVCRFHEHRLKNKEQLFVSVRTVLVRVLGALLCTWRVDHKFGVDQKYIAIEACDLRSRPEEQS